MAAEKAITAKPDWAKGYWRKGLALQGQGKIPEAKAAFEKGLKIEPENAQLKTSLGSVSQPEDPIFGAAGRAKLMANPETAAFFNDVQFKNMFDMCAQQP